METLVQRWGLRVAQRPTYDQLNKETVIVRDKGFGEAACRRPQRLPRKSEGPVGRTIINRPRGTWPDGSITTILTKTKVSRGGELDVENLEGGETYLGAERLHLRDMRRLLHGRPTGT